MARRFLPDQAFMELLPGTSPQPKENGGRKDAKLAPIAAATSDVKPYASLAPFLWRVVNAASQDAQ